MCEYAIAIATRSLTEGDIPLAKKLPEITAEIDHEEREIESMCMKLLLRKQPVAADLRIISSTLKMVTDMERIGDNSGDIAEIITMANISTSSDTLNTREMATAVIKMVTNGIDAFVKHDIGLAKRVI